MFQFKLGSRVKDKISGLTGIAAARGEYLNGCIRYCIEPDRVKDDGSPYDGYWFDEKQLELVSEDTGLVRQYDRVLKEEPELSRTGGPQKLPSAVNNPPRM